MESKEINCLVDHGNNPCNCFKETPKDFDLCTFCPNADHTYWQCLRPGVHSKEVCNFGTGVHTGTCDACLVKTLRAENKKLRHALSVGLDDYKTTTASLSTKMLKDRIRELEDLLLQFQKEKGHV
jgi:hypothetical protein